MPSHTRAERKKKRKRNQFSLVEALRSRAGRNDPGRRFGRTVQRAVTGSSTNGGDQEFTSFEAFERARKARERKRKREEENK